VVDECVFPVCGCAWVCMGVSECVRACVCVCVCVHVYIRARPVPLWGRLMFAWVCVGVCKCKCVYASGYVRVFVSVYMCNPSTSSTVRGLAHVYSHCVCVCACVYVHTDGWVGWCVWVCVCMYA